MSAARLILADARALPLRPESIDSCATDPPYGIGFMGRQWDTFKPGRSRSPAISPSQIEYDTSNAGLRRFQEWTREWGTEALRVLKPGAYAVVSGAPRSYHRMASGLEDAGFEIRDCFSWLFGQGFPKSLNLKGDRDGWGTALKPANEPIVIARKPFTTSVHKNVERWGTGAINVEACRVGTSKSVPASPSRHEDTLTHGKYGAEDGTASGFDPDSGRWPPNVLLTHAPECRDECAPRCPVLALDTQSGTLISGANPTSRGTDKFRDVYSGFAGQKQCDPARGLDSGGASRFFPTFHWDDLDEIPFHYCPKASRTEREEGVAHLARRQRDESRDPEAPGANNPRNRGGQLRGNYHPTVKPIALMRWLIRLITPPGGTVIDLFTGSGTTGAAAVDLGFNFVGIEREAKYIRIANARIRGRAPLFAGSAA